MWSTGQEQARLDAEFEAKMRKLEQDGEDLNQIQALIAAKKEARQCYRNSSARVRCHSIMIIFQISAQDSPPLNPAAKKRRKMEELFDRIYENLETDDEHNEFNRRAFRLTEILSNKGISPRDKVGMKFPLFLFEIDVLMIHGRESRDPSSPKLCSKRMA